MVTSSAQSVLAYSADEQQQPTQPPEITVSEKTIKLKYTYEPNKFNTTILKYIHEPQRTVILEYQNGMKKYTAKPNRYTNGIDKYVKGNWEQKAPIILHGYTANIDKTQKLLAHYQDKNGVWHTGFAKVTTTKEIVGLTVLAIIILVVLVILIVTIGNAIHAVPIAQQPIPAALQAITTGYTVRIGGTSTIDGIPTVTLDIYYAQVISPNVYTRLTGGTLPLDRIVALMTTVKIIPVVDGEWKAVTGTTVMIYDIAEYLTIYQSPAIFAWNMANGWNCIPLLSGNII
jgi:hypothetical protein